MEVATFGAKDFLRTYHDWLRKIAGTTFQPKSARVWRRSKRGHACCLRVVKAMSTHGCGQYWLNFPFVSVVGLPSTAVNVMQPQQPNGQRCKEAILISVQQLRAYFDHTRWSSNACSLSFAGFVEAGRPASRRGLATLGNGKAIAIAMFVWSEGFIGFFTNSSSNLMTGLHVINLKQHPKVFKLTSGNPSPQGFHKRLSISALQVPFADLESRCPYSSVVLHQPTQNRLDHTCNIHVQATLK